MIVSPPFSKRGFTLIELSIVLVIIGLIVGGVLVGRDLILAAQVRKTGTLVEQIQTATMAFQNKYNCLPGDCANPNNFFPAGNVWCPDGYLASAGTTCTAGNGDGDIYGAESFGHENSGHENSYFFQQLIVANLLNDTRYCTLNGLTCQIDYHQQYWGLTIPVPSKGHLDNTAAAIAISSLKHLTWGIGTPAPSANHALYMSTYTDGDDGVMAAPIVFMLDSKFDDGIPLSGRVQAVGIITANAVTGQWSNNGVYYPGIGNCTNTGTVGAVYTTDTNPVCPVLWMMGF